MTFSDILLIYRGGEKCWNCIRTSVADGKNWGCRKKSSQRKSAIRVEAQLRGFAIAKALKTTPSDLMGWSEETDDALDKEYHSEKQYQSNYITKLSEDPELMEIINKAAHDVRYRERLVLIAKILEKK